MSEATIDTDPTAEDAAREAEKRADAARLKKMAALHFTAAMAALTLWGAADAWAVASGWALANAVAIANAFIAATVLAGLVHEWGHFTGARLSGARSPVHEKPVNYFFMFDFPFDSNDARQFQWMSWGGILAPWVLVVAVLVLVPIDSVARLALLAVLAAKAAAASLFEVPVVTRARRSGDPRAELGRELKSGGLKSANRWSWAVGAVVCAVIWLVI
jgi:hypothetical protein